MADHSYPVEVKSDFLEKITRAKPIQAVAEFIWNSFDADASRIEVSIGENGLGAMETIVVKDNGTGMEYASAPELFGSLGGSWKRMTAITKRDGRYLHGQDGRGRFKAFALGSNATWDVGYEKGKDLYTFSVAMNAANMKEVVIADEVKANGKRRAGVTVTISNLHKDFPSIVSESGLQELTEIFALYLTDYSNVSLSIAGTQIDPSTQIASRTSVNLSDITEESKSYPVRLDIIEWKSATNRALFLCNDKGFPLTEIERRFHIGAFQFSAYLRSPYVSKLQKEGTLELAEMNPLVTKAADEAQAAIKDYFRTRAAQEAHSVVEEWKDTQIYPYSGEPNTRIEEVERQVFDIVAVTATQYMPDFSATPAKNKAFNLRLLRQAIEKSPEDLQLILGEVLNLPKRKQEELAELLRDVSLSAIIGAAKVVADRLKFLTGLEAILFDAEPKSRLKERSQLHRIIAQNCWLFGEEFNLSVDDQSLTEVLRKHKAILGDDVAIDEPVKHISKERGIIDLMLSRAIRRHKADELTHLVVELKAPKIKIDKKEITQVEEYAISVTKDERFKGVKTNWVFWAISDDYGEYAAYRMSTPSASNGNIYEAGQLSVWVKTWAQVLDENRARLQFFQERLEYQADKGASLEHLQERYAEFLKGVLVEEQDSSVQKDAENGKLAQPEKTD